MHDLYTHSTVERIHEMSESMKTSNHSIFSFLYKTRVLVLLSVINGILLLGGLVLYLAEFPQGGGVASFFNGPLVIKSPVKSIGVVGESENSVVETSLTNASKTTMIRILGAQTSCACTTLTGLPMNLLPGETRTLSINVDTTRKNGEFEENIRLFTDNPISKVVNLKIVGTVLPSNGTKTTYH